MSTTQQTTIPMPNNPAHIDNLKTISLLKAQGFCGSDASLRESIFEYGMAWRELGNGELLIVHRNPSMTSRFDRSTFALDLDVKREWDWVDYDALMSFVGMELSEWLQLPLPTKIGDLVSYYGEMEIYGESYWEGFEISDE